MVKPQSQRACSSSALPRVHSSRFGPGREDAEQLTGLARPVSLLCPNRFIAVAGPHASRMTIEDGYGMLLKEIAQAEGFVFVALVTLTVIAILDLFLPRSGG
jgi:hypothetical protein